MGKHSMAHTMLAELLAAVSRLEECCVMQELVEATDWQQALQDGRVTPMAGVDKEFDSAVAAKRQAEEALTVRTHRSCVFVCVCVCVCAVAFSAIKQHRGR
jgi:hypothetical protein